MVTMDNAYEQICSGAADWLYLQRAFVNTQSNGEYTQGSSQSEGKVPDECKIN